MSSYAYGGDPPGLAGKYHYGVGSVGIPGALLAVGGYIEPSVTHPTDDAKEYYGLITLIPAGLTILTGEAGDFDASGADGTYVVPWDLYEWGAFLAPSTSFTVPFGAAGAVVNLAISNLATAATLSTVAVAVVPAPGVVDLAISNLATAATLSTVVVGVVEVAKTINLTIANLTSVSTLSNVAVSVVAAVGTYARAPRGNGYLPQQNEMQSRPADTQRNYR